MRIFFSFHFFLVWASLFHCGKIKQAGETSGIIKAPEKNAASVNSLSAAALNKVSIEFVQPKNLADLQASNQITVEIKFADLPTDQSQVSWNLYYSNKLDSLDQLKMIKKSMPISETIVTWDVTSLPAGSYFLAAELIHGNTSQLSYFSSSIQVGSEKPSPFVKVLTPNFEIATMERFFLSGQNMDITYRLADLDSSHLLLKIEVSPDLGATWSVVAEKIDATPGPGTYTWAIPPDQPRSARYLLRLTAKDDDGNEAFGYSSNEFGIAPQGVTWVNGARQVAKTSCTNGTCHTQANNTGPFQFDTVNANLYKVDPTYRNGPFEYGRNNDRRINYQQFYNALVVKKTMPKQGSLSQQDLDTLLLWMWNPSNGGMPFGDANPPTFTWNTPVELKPGTTTLPSYAVASSLSISLDITDADGIVKWFFAVRNRSNQFQEVISDVELVPPSSGTTYSYTVTLDGSKVKAGDECDLIIRAQDNNGINHRFESGRFKIQ